MRLDTSTALIPLSCARKGTIALLRQQRTGRFGQERVWKVCMDVCLEGLREEPTPRCHFNHPEPQPPSTPRRGARALYDSQCKEGVTTNLLHHSLPGVAGSADNSCSAPAAAAAAAPSPLSTAAAAP